MKRLLFLLISLIGTFFLTQAQRPSFKPQTHQLELQLGTIHNLMPAENAVFLDTQPFAANYLNGVRYTYHYSLKHAFRLGGQFLSATYDPDPDILTQFRFYAPVKAYEFNLGYVYKFHVRRSQLFFAVDFLYDRGSIQIISDQIGPQEDNPFNSFGGRMGVGYRFFFSPYLSFAVEGYGKYLNRPNGQFSPEPDYPFFQSTQLSWNAMATVSMHLVKMKKRCTCPSPGRSRYR